MALTPKNGGCEIKYDCSELRTPDYYTMAVESWCPWEKSSYEKKQPFLKKKKKSDLSKFC